MDIIDDNLDVTSTSSSRFRPRVTYGNIGEDSTSNTSIPSHFLWRRNDRVDNANEQPWLKSISQPKQNEDITQYTTYKYDDKAGVGTTIYVVDTGANPNHVVRRDIL